MHSIKIALSRYGWFTAGVLLNAFGVDLITKAALGTSPISSLPYVLSLRFPVTLGQFTFLIGRASCRERGYVAVGVVS